MRLGASLPLDRLEKIVTHRRVYTHRYPYIRQDAAVAMSMMGMRGKVAFDILTELLTHTEPEHSMYERDAYLVRREAWLSLWTLFGAIPGAGKPEMFQVPPRMPRGRPKDLFPWGRLRPGVSAEMVAALDPHSKDLEHMKRVQQQYRQLWPELEARIMAEAKDAAQDKQAPPPGGSKPAPGGAGTDTPPGSEDKGAPPQDKQPPAKDDAEGG